MSDKPIHTLDGLIEAERRRAEAQQELGKRSGIYGKAIDEPVPTWDKCDSEKLVARGENNCFMVIGRDRPSHSRSGFGGKGATQAGRIDLIAGLGSSYNRVDGTIGPPNEKTAMGPNFALDAARIYISQKCDLDRYMGLAEVTGEADAGISGIALKADTIRIHSRHDVKIVTGRSRLEGFDGDGERLSDGSINQRVGTISFIAGNFNEPERSHNFNMLKPAAKKYQSEKTLQPLVKGKNLIKCLESIVEALTTLKSQIDNHQSEIKQMSQDFMAHIHPFPVGPAPQATAGGAVVYAQALAQEAALAAIDKSLELIKTNYLTGQGGKHINSKYVFTT